MDATPEEIANNLCEIVDRESQKSQGESQKSQGKRLNRLVCTPKQWEAVRAYFAIRAPLDENLRQVTIFGVLLVPMKAA
jgi:hypothetical protein